MVIKAVVLQAIFLQKFMLYSCFIFAEGTTLAYYCEFYDFFFLLQSAEMLMISCTNYCKYHQHFISSAKSMICLIFEIIIIIIIKLVWRKPGNVRVNSKDPKKRSIFSLNQMDELIKNASVEFLSCIREKKGQLWLDRLLY
jgi:hypothetical protein